LDGCSRYEDCRARQFSDIDVQLRYLRAAHRDRNRMSARIARFGPELRMIVVLRLRVVVVVGYRCGLVFV
jgi:hypothetical protein